MARLANGVVTGQLDNKFGSIRVGDTVRCIADGLEYTVDGYGGIRNESGAAFKIKQWNPADFIVVQSRIYSEPLFQVGGKAAELKSKPAAEFQESLDAAEKAISEARESLAPVAQNNPDLSLFSDEQLSAELAARGYVGYATKTINLNIG